MNDPNDLYSSNAAPQEGSAEPQGASGQPDNGELERIRREAEEARKREEELRELVRLSLQQQQQYSSTAPQPTGYESIGQPEPEFKIPEDFDPTDPKEVAKLVDEISRKRAEEMARQLMESYTSDRQRQLAVMASTQFQQFKERMAAAGYGKLASAVEDYIRQNNIPIDQLVTQDAYEGIAAYIVGQDVLRSQVLSPRPPNLAANGRAPAPQPVAEVPLEVQEEFKRLVNFGDDIDLDELARIAEKGEMTAEDYARLAKRGE